MSLHSVQRSPVLPCAFIRTISYVNPPSCVYVWSVNSSNPKIMYLNLPMFSQDFGIYLVDGVCGTRLSAGPQFHGRAS